jgi:GAF domain-containing protein
VDSVTHLSSSDGRSRRSKDQLVLDLADMKRLHALNLRLLNGGELRELLMEVVKASTDLVQTDKGNIQLYNEREQALNIVASLGFSQEFLDHFRAVPVGYSPCGTAMANGERIILEDVNTDPRFVEFAPLYAKFGFVAVQSTPLIGRDGRCLGMLSNHFSHPRRPDTREMQLLDLFAQQAVWVIEQERAKAALRESEARFRILADSTPVLMWLTDLSGAVFVNKAYLDFLGLEDQQDVAGFKWASQVHPDDRIDYVNRYLQCVEARSPFRVIFVSSA